MPVRSLNSSVLRWPDKEAVHKAVTCWAHAQLSRSTTILRAGYFGSYARGDWGVGSDVDLVLILDRSDLPLERRAIEWDTTTLPVPADLIVYTQNEWEKLAGRFRDTLEKETVWVYIADDQQKGHVR